MKMTHSIFLLSSKLTGCLEVHAKMCVLALIRLVDIFNCVDVKWYCKAVDGQNDSLRLPVNENLGVECSVKRRDDMFQYSTYSQAFRLPRQTCLALVTLKTLPSLTLPIGGSGATFGILRDTLRLQSCMKFFLMFSDFRTRGLHHLLCSTSGLVSQHLSAHYLALRWRAVTLRGILRDRNFLVHLRRWLGSFALLVEEEKCLL